MMLDRSLNEIEALALRASRGAGMSWGLAQESSKCTRWLMSYNLPGAEILSKLLELNDRVPLADLVPEKLTGVWFNRKGYLCPVIAGAALVDVANKFSDENSTEMQNISYPLIVVSFAGQSAGLINQAVSTEWNGLQITTDGQQVSISGDREQIIAEHTKSLRCTVVNQINPVQPKVTRGNVDNEHWETLSRFAHRTYAPATEESRLLGAGAGLSDND